MPLYLPPSPPVCQDRISKISSYTKLDQDLYSSTSEIEADFILVHHTNRKKDPEEKLLTQSGYFLVPNKLNLEHIQLIEMLSSAKNTIMPKEFYDDYAVKYQHGIFYDLRPFYISAVDIQAYENGNSLSLGYHLKYPKKPIPIEEIQVENFFYGPCLFSDKYGPAYKDITEMAHKSYYSLNERSRALLQEIRGVFYSLILVIEKKLDPLRESLGKKTLEKLQRNLDSLKENLKFWKRIALFVIERREFMATQMRTIQPDFVPTLKESQALGSLIINFHCFF